MVKSRTPKVTRTPKIETLVTTVSTARHTIKLTREMILEMLKSHMIPSNAKVRFIVPGGGDWSGMAVDVNSDAPVWIEWESETVTDERR